MLLTVTFDVSICAGFKKELHQLSSWLVLLQRGAKQRCLTSTSTGIDVYTIPEKIFGNGDRTASFCIDLETFFQGISLLGLVPQ